MGIKRLQAVVTGAAMLLWGLATPAGAGQAELDLLQSYIGNWQGAGELVGGEQPESFKCRLNVAKGNQSKINYAGRCSLVNLTPSVRGALASDDKITRYQAAVG